MRVIGFDEISHKSNTIEVTYSYEVIWNNSYLYVRAFPVSILGL